MIQPQKFWHLVDCSTSLHHLEPTETDTMPEEAKPYFLSPQILAEQWPDSCLPDLHSFCPYEMRREFQKVHERWGINSARVSVWAEQGMLDGEGILESARLAIEEQFAIFAVAPLDWSCCVRLSELGVMAVEVQVSIRGLETGIQRPQLIQKIIADSQVPIWLGGNITPADLDFAISIGAAGVCIR